MSLSRDNTRAFDRRLRLVASVVDLDPRITEIRSKLDGFRAGAGQPVLDLLAEAVTNGEDTDLLFAAAVAENTSTPAAHNAVVTGVRERLHAAIRSTYAASAVDSYSAVANKFDTAAKKLAAAHQAVDIEASPELVLDLPDKQRKLWKDAPSMAADLARLSEVLTAAAVLAGISDDSDESVIALVVDAAEANRRDLWAAWRTEDTEAAAARTARQALPFTDSPLPTRSRCGRWSALLNLGVTLRAHPADEPFNPYRKPMPMGVVVSNGPAGPVRVPVDPEAATIRS